MTGKEIHEKKNGKLCPRCGSELIRMFGHMWDCDYLICPEKDCMYERILPETTIIDEDGTERIIKLED